jgi:hypothetical protein
MRDAFARIVLRRQILIGVLATIAVMGIASASASADTGVVGLWHLNENGGLLASDSSGLANNGTLSGEVSWVPGVSGSGLSFDDTSGTNDGSVDVAASSSLEPANITVQAWVRRTGSPGNFKYIVDNGYSGCIAGSYGLYSGPNGGMVFYVSAPGSGGPNYAQSPDAGTGVWDGNWHLITGTYDGSLLRLYVDGTEVGSGTPWTQPIGYGLTNNDLFFGSYMGCKGLDYPGAVDEIEIWNRALSSDEVKAETLYPHLVLAPANASVPYGSSQTYTATEYNANGANLGDVTGATTFTITPDGICSAATCTPTAVGAHTVTGTDSGVTTGATTLNVTPAPVTVTANNVSRAYGVANPALGATITGFAFGQTLATSGITGAAACTTTATTTSPPGSYPITCTQGTLTASNYSFPAGNFVPGKLTVMAAATSLSAPPISVVNSILSLVPTFTATLTSGGTPIPGQSVAFSLSVNPKATVCTGTTNAAGVASCKPSPLTIVSLLLSSSYTASYAGNTTYSPSTTTAPVILLSLHVHASVNLRRLTKYERKLLLHDLAVCRNLKHNPTFAARAASLRGPRCSVTRFGH